MNKLTTALLAALVLTQVPSAFNQLRSYESAAHAEYACRRWEDKADKDKERRCMCRQDDSDSWVGIESRTEDHSMSGASTSPSLSGGTDDISRTST